MLDQLDAEQRAAATSTARLIRCRASAGSGKTRVVIARIGWLVEERGVPPERILAITFAKKAAGEMAARLGDLAERVRVGTVHSVCYEILRREVPGRRVCEEGVKKRLIRAALKATGSVVRFTDAVTAITRHKDIGRSLPPGLGPVFEAYQVQLAAQRLWDFSDLLVETERVLRVRGAARARWAGRWQHVLVDEAQDVSPVQWRVLGHLVTLETSVFLAGDPGQGIYGFRGADPDGMLDAADGMFGSFEERPITRNYRSVPAVVSAGNALIVGRRGALRMQAVRSGGTADVSFLLPAEDRASEAEQIVEALRREHEAGARWGDCLVLVRMNSQSEALEAACLKAQVPAIVAGGVGFYGRREVADVLAYLRLAQGWDEEALDRVYNRPSRYLGEAFHEELRRQGGWDAAIQGRASFSRSYMEQRLAEFLRDVRRLQLKCEDGASPAELVRVVLEQVGSEGYRVWLLGEEPSVEDEVRGENLDALLEAAGRHASVAALLEMAARCERRNARPSNGTEGCVTISTVHKQKGLEAPMVVVAGLTAGVLPHAMALRDGGDGAEETRIAYVAVTRAENRLILSSYGEPSRFWHELGGPRAEDDGPDPHDDEEFERSADEEGSDDDVASFGEEELKVRDRMLTLLEESLTEAEEDADARDAAAEAGPCDAGDGNGGRAPADTAGDPARGGGEPALGGARDRGADDGLGPARRGDPGDGAGGAVDVAPAAAGGGAAGAGGAPWQCAWCRWPNEPEAVSCSQCEMPKPGMAEVPA